MRSVLDLFDLYILIRAAEITSSFYRYESSVPY